MFSKLYFVYMSILLVAVNTFALTYDSDFYSDVVIIENESAVLYESDGLNNNLSRVGEVSSPRCSVSMGDFDKDEHLELFLGAANSAAAWYESSGDNMSGWISNWGNDVLDSAICDFNGNGAIDLLALKSDGTVVWYENTGNNSLAWRSNPMGSGSGAKSIAIGDIDKDGISDMLVCKPNAIARYQVGGSYSLTWLENYYFDSLPASISQSDIVIGDFDSDSYVDIFVIHTDGVQWYEFVDDNLVEIGGRLVGGAATCVSIGDVDEDGVVELLVGREGDYIVWYENTGNNSLTYTIGTQLGYNASDIACAPKYDSFVNVLYQKIVYSSQDHVTFPQLQISTSDKLLLGFNTGVHPVNETHHGIISTDNGDTWQDMDPFVSTLTVSTLSGQAPAVILEFRTLLVSSSVIRAYLSYAFEDWNVVTKHTSDIVLPFEVESASFHRTLLMLETGELLATLYAKPLNSNYYSVCIIESEDFGKTWHYKSTAAERLSWMGEEGPTESAMVQLRNGDLLLVARTGDIGPPVEQSPDDVHMAYVISEDKGATWSTPLSLGVPGVDPDMIVLEDGRVLLSYGRPGVHLMLADSSGSNWSQPFLVYGGPGGGYTGLRKNSQNDLFLVYSESDFASWQNYLGDVNYLKLVKFNVSPVCYGQGYPVGDINFDCVCDYLDLLMLANDWLR